METIALSTPPVVSGALPLLGHLTEFSKNRTALIERGYAEHGSIFTVKLGPQNVAVLLGPCLLYTSPSPRDRTRSRMPSSA